MKNGKRIKNCGFKTGGLIVSGFTLLAHGGAVLADEQKSIPKYVGWSLELGKSWII